MVWSLAALLLVAARWIDPPTTAVHIERRVQSWIHGTPYQERYKFVPLSQISPDLQHAVIAAEDARFYQHHGFDWHQIQIAAEEDMEGERTRGASTLTQQLVKNLFFGTSRSIAAQGRRVHAGAGRRIRAGQAADPGDLPQRGRMGSGHLWGGAGVPLLRPNLRAEYRQGAVSTTGGDSACSAETASRTHDPLQRDHPEPDAPDGLVIFCHHERVLRARDLHLLLWDRQSCLSFLLSSRAASRRGICIPGPVRGHCFK